MYDRSNRFLDEYFAAELRRFRWVQIELSVAKQLAEKHKDFMINSGHEYIVVLNSGHEYIVIENDASKTYY